MTRCGSTACGPKLGGVTLSLRAMAPLHNAEQEMRQVRTHDPAAKRRDPVRSVSTAPHRPCITSTHPNTGPRRFTGAGSKRTEQALVRHSVPDRTLFRLSYDTASCPPRDPAQILNQNLSVPFGPGTRRTQILYRTTLQNLYQNTDTLHNPDTMN